MYSFGKGLSLSYENMGAFGKFNDKTANGSAKSLFTIGCGPNANNKRNAALNSNAFGYCCNNCHTQSKNCKNIGLRSTDFEFPSPCPHRSWNL